MSGTAIIILVVAIVVVLALALIVQQELRRRRLRQRFGPEYQRVAAEASSQRAAAQELAHRERRHEQLPLRPLTPEARQRYADRWTDVQERFVDDPAGAVGGADILITEVMRDRGYPAEGYQQQVADLSVEHGWVLDHYRSAHDVSTQVADGGVTTEELRLAMVHYRALFEDLLSHDAPAAETDPVSSGIAGGPDATR